MDVLHISDMHFGPRHWDGNDQLLLEKINSFGADIVINTGDNTTDGLESEFADAGSFLSGIECKNVISTLGNHDKRNRRSHELFHEYIDSSEIITISKTIKTEKTRLFLDPKSTKVDENFTDVNFVKSVKIKGKKVLVISIDSTELYSDDGYVEEKVLNAVSRAIKQADYDIPLLLTHYSILGTDECPLKNSAVLINFVQKHKIEYVFCGHTHVLELMRTNDLYHGHTFNHFMCGSLSARNLHNDNMFLFYENLGAEDMHLHLTRISQQEDTLHFNEEKIY